MNKKEHSSWLIWVFVVVICVLILGFSFSDNDALAVGFPFAIFFGIIGYSLIKSLISNAKGRKKIKELRSNVPQIKVDLVSPAIPVYSSSYITGLFFFSLALGLIVHLFVPSYDFQYIGAACVVFLLYAIYLCIQCVRTKTLSFYQEDSSVALYEKQVTKENLFSVEELRYYLSGDIETFMNKKCEHIQFYNETEFWSCNTFDHNRVRKRLYCKENRLYFCNSALSKPK